jgi:hypothetical protein
VSDTDQYKDMQFWDLTAANTTNLNGGHVTLQSNPNLCLDAGSTPTNGLWVTIETCDSTATGQNWI